MASEVLFKIWQGGQLLTPVRTTLAKVKTIMVVDYIPAMPWQSESEQCLNCCGDTSESGGQGLKQSQQS
jgi:hypothetical protein